MELHKEGEGVLTGDNAENEKKYIIEKFVEILQILPYGKNLSLENHSGQVHGVMVDQDGILNAVQWLVLKYI